MNDQKMTYMRACEVLGFRTPKPLAENARLAASRLDRMTVRTPLRYSVACQVLIDTARDGIVE